MKVHNWRKSLLLLLAALTMVTLLAVIPFAVRAQQREPTLTPTLMPTVTGTPAGVVVAMTYEYDQYNVRSGPNTRYQAIGVVLAGQKIPAKGRSAGGDWILIDYPGVPGSQGWIYSYYVNIPPGSSLPVVEPPPLPTPAQTATIDPTLASQFIVTAVPTRLATFTPPPPLVIPTPVIQVVESGAAGIPMGLVIVALASLGVFMGLVSLVRGR